MSRAPEAGSSLDCPYARHLKPAGATFDTQREALKVSGAGMDMAS